MARAAAIILLVLACLALAYTLGLSLVVASVVEQGAILFWRSSGPGSLFPVPLPPGSLTALSPVTALDAFIYQWGVKSLLVPIVDVILILAALLAVWRVPRPG